MLLPQHADGLPRSLVPPRQLVDELPQSRDQMGFQLVVAALPAAALVEQPLVPPRWLVDEQPQTRDQMGFQLVVAAQPQLGLPAAWISTCNNKTVLHSAALSA